MLINKKFLALALLPLFGACVVTDNDDDNAGTDTDPSTTASTTASTTDSTTASTTATDSDTDTADTGTESETDTGGDAGYCQVACVEAIDCCAGEPTCEGGLGEYPYDWSCDAGACTFAGCTSDDQCTAGGVLPTWICADFGEFSNCAAGCTEDVDCQTPGFEDYTCTGPDGTCAAPGCAADADCQGPGTEDWTCDVASGLCEVPPCTSDDDCDGDLACDVGTGFCGCTGDKQCGEGFACVLPA